MLFQIIIVTLIILATLYWAWQGVFSCALMLVSVVFASCAAIGWYEELVPLAAGYRPDYAQPVAFFLLFAFCFSALRWVGGILTPKNVRLPKLIDLGISFPLAFLTAMMSFGTLVIAVEMLPTYQKIFGYDRYPNGLAKDPVSLWIPADGFVQWVWKETSGGSLGGSETFASVHPDLDRELYGNRHVVQFGSHPEVLPSLLEVPATYVIKEPAAIRKIGIMLNGDQPQKIIVVRSEIHKGDHAPQLSCDNDAFYRVTPAEVRMITTKPAAQYNPIGYMDDGTVFTPLDLDLGHIVDDYFPGESVTTHDWVFAIPAEAEPRYFEEKTLARQDLAAAVVEAEEARPNVLIASSKGYPPRDYLKDLPSVQVVVKHSFGEATDQPVTNQDLYLLRPVIVKRRIRSEIDDCYALLEQAHGPARESNLNIYRTMKVQWDDDHLVPISQFLTLWFVSHETADPKADVNKAELEIQNKLLPIILDPEKHLLVWQSKTGADGKTPIKRIAPGGYVCIVWVTERAKDDFHFWATDINLPAATGEPLHIIKLDDASAYIRRK
jgi:hypothetical protein